MGSRRRAAAAKTAESTNGAASFSSTMRELRQCYTGRIRKTPNGGFFVRIQQSTVVPWTFPTATPRPPLDPSELVQDADLFYSMTGSVSETAIRLEGEGVEKSSAINAASNAAAKAVRPPEAPGVSPPNEYDQD